MSVWRRRILRRVVVLLDINKDPEEMVELVNPEVIEQRGADAAYTEDGTQFVDLPGDTIVSMNLWGFTQPMVSELWSRLSAFLAQQVPQNPMKCEFYLPNAVNQQLEDGTARVRVLPCEEVWHGVTYREDLASVKEAICALKAAGVYEERLWPD